MPLPVLEIHAPPSWDPFDAALRQWHNEPGTFDGLLFTSTNAVHRAVSRSAALGLSLTDCARSATVAVIGPATADAAHTHGLTPQIVAPRAHSEGLLENLRDDSTVRRWLIPRALRARGVLEAGLREWGAAVTIAPVYSTAPPADPLPVQAAFAGGLDVITFCSGSAVDHLRAVLGGAWPPGMHTVAVASIGPITSDACRAAGLRVAIEAPQARLDALVAAIAHHQEIQ